MMIELIISPATPTKRELVNKHIDNKIQINSMISMWIQH